MQYITKVGADKSNDFNRVYRSNGCVGKAHKGALPLKEREHSVSWAGLVRGRVLRGNFCDSLTIVNI